ncbi:MAG: hypothetical protein Q4D42_03115 [Eubacteriales bacterium]|nr:hypothetical protein [Eubacteriales bacterium]
MYEIIKNVIASGNFDLTAILNKINTLWLESSITDSQRDNLVAAARAAADPQNSYAPLQEQIDKLASDIAALAARVAELEGGTAETPEYPEYVQPTGAHDAYNIGDKVTYNGNRYTCQMDGCVWSPDVHPDGWKEDSPAE